MKNQIQKIDGGDSEDLVDIDNDDFEIDFKQWTTTDCTELIFRKLPVDEFINFLREKLDKITAHSFIAGAQSQYLKQLKDNLKPNEAVVLVDFAENYQFQVQDEIQGYHWNKNYCSLHPFVVYYKSDDILSQSSVCVLSDDLDHDVFFVYKVLQATSDFMKNELNLQLQLIHYFSDGCAAQYKNYKHFLNLHHHKEDFLKDCIWNFFATSHGKSAYGGIGGTVKRITAFASLQCAVKDQILTTKEMFAFCRSEIQGIKFVFITSSEIEMACNYLKERYSAAKTIPGTRGFNQFIPVSQVTIKTKCVSEDEEFCLEFNLTNEPQMCIDTLQIS